MRKLIAIAGSRGAEVFPLLRFALLLALSFCRLGGPGRAQAGIVDRVTVDRLPGHLQQITPLAFTVHGRMEVRPDDLNVDFGKHTCVYQWPGIYFRTAFTGSELFFRTDAGKHQIFHLTIDGQAPLIVAADGAAEYRVHGLARANHSVRLQVVTELQAGPAGFGGFALPAAEHGLPVPPLNRQIEFIGDSHTVGYGNTSPGRDCSQEQIWSSTDNSKAFGALVADHSHAEYQVNAISGRGVGAQLQRLCRRYDTGRLPFYPLQQANPL